MARRRAWLVACLAAVALWCQDSQPRAGELSPDASAPRDVCDDVARDSRLPVLCPRDDALADAHVGNRDLERSRCAYVSELIGAHERGMRHVIFAGRCKPLPLRGRAGRWPPRNARVGSHLRLVGAATPKPGERRLRPVRPTIAAATSVRGGRALVLAVAAYPEGGIHGGHYALVFNEGGHGYVLSSHSSRADRGLPPRRRELRALKRIARSMVAIEPRSPAASVAP